MTIRMVKKLMCLALSIIPLGQGLAAVSLEQVRVNPLAGEQLMLELEFDAPPLAVTELVRQQPERLVLQIADGYSALKENIIPIERQGVGVIDVRRVGDNLEVALGMEQMQAYRLQRDGNRLLLLLGEGVSGMDGSGASLPPGVINAITSIDFRRGREGQGQVLVKLDKSTAAVDMQVKGNRLIAKFHNTHIDDALLQVLDVNDFATLVSRISSRREGSNVLVTVDTGGAFDYRYDQSERLFVLELARPAAKTTSPSKASKQYTGKPISMNFQDIPVRTVLQLIADFNNFNLVTTDAVQGNITLRLDGVPWEQALDTILQVRGLDKRLDGNILLVAPATELAQQEQQQLENRQAREVLAPLVSEFLQVNYAKAADVVTLLTNENTRLLTERGAVAVDDRTNMLVIKDTQQSIDNIKRMLTLLDIPIKQVVIEARMVTIDDGFEEAFGVRWGYNNSTQGGTNEVSIGGNLDGGYNVNLPSAESAGTVALQIARLGGGRVLDLELSALERENKAEIVASPRVTTSNQKPALIEQGTEVAYVASVDDGGVPSVEFKKMVLSLKVTPQITPDNRVVLDLVVTQDTPNTELSSVAGGEIAVNTQTITTQVLVNDSETLVLGGIFQQNISRSVTKVPLLGDIPVVGRLFKSTSDENTKRELIIFVTPRIVHDSI